MAQKSPPKPPDLPLPGERLLDGFHASEEAPFGYFQPGDTRILGWLEEAIEEGSQINASDPSYDGIEKAMEYVVGRQKRGEKPSYLPDIIVNRTKKAIRSHKSALTDIRPLFNYKTKNPRFTRSLDILNNLILAWWTNTFADRALADAVAYASTAGCGDVLVEFDPNFQEGDNRLISRDPRDTLPIRPSRDPSIQDWEGVIIREAHSINALRAAYPEFRDRIRPGQNKWGGVHTKFQRITKSTPVSTLDGLKGGPRKSMEASSEVVLYRTYLRDRSINLNPGTILVGKPGTNWCYKVAPGQPLYPRKRLILATEEVILYDGPNPDWHGMYPISRLKLDPWPWIFLGLGLVHDLLPMQDATNEVFNYILMNFSQHVQPGTYFDANAVPESVVKRFDKRKPNFKLRVKATMGDGVKPDQPAVLPAYAMQLVTTLLQQFDDLAETANLQSLMALRQMPGADTIEAYYRALTPGIREEIRMLQMFLREVGEMVKCNIFQYYSKARRIMLLGDSGRALEDFDYDPDTLVPAFKVGDPLYVPELDASKPRDERALWFHKLFTFYVHPDSAVAMHSQDQKMLYLQLGRMGYMDFWTIMEKLEVPNVGSPPPIPLPIRNWEYDVAKGPGGIPVPPPMEVRIPETITERLMAQQQLGIGQTQNPAGRKATGQEAPSAAVGSGGMPIIRESPK